MVSSLRTALTLLLAVAVAPLEAQSPPNLSGTWVLQVAESDFGMLPAPERRTDIITHEEPRLVVQRMTMAQGQETSLALTYAVDGEPHENDAGGAVVVSRLNWDGSVLVMISTVSSPQGEVMLTDRYTLSPDGQILTQARVLQVQGQEFSQRMVLKKQ
jgi:hypothetical protein